MTERTIWLLALGAAGGLAARRFRMPGGSLLGAMLVTGLISVVQVASRPLPQSIRAVALVLLGIYAGSSMDRTRLGEMRSVLPVAFCAILGLIATGFGLGWLLQHQLAPGVSLGTVVLGMMPGGASGLTAAAHDLGAEEALVASMHMVRLVIVFGLLPLALSWFAQAARE